MAQATTGHNRRRPGLPRSTAPNRGVVAAGRAFPRLRRDLVLIPQEGAGAGVVVQDPRAQRFFRFGDTERFLLSRLTGQSSVEQIRQDVCLWSGEQWECEEIESFLLDLERAGLLESGAGAPGSPEIAARGGVLGVLARKGLRFRSSDSAETVDDPSVEGRAADREREHFARAVRAIARGQGGEARQALDRVLVLNPANRRAAALRTLLDRRPSVSAAEEPAERPAVAPAPASGSGASRRPLNPFYLRYRLGDPDKMLAALARPLGFVWTRGFALVYLALLAVAGWIGLTHHAEILGSVPVLDPGLWVLLLVAAAVGLTVFHEAAHGLAARHLGVPVREVGVMLIFFVMPAVYVDVSGAWLLRRRSQRLLVTIAGPLFDLGATALALLAWRVLPPGPLQATVLLIGGVSALSLLMNLNPLIRLDGYWALSDVSGIPNLRAVAVGELRQTLGGWFGRRGPDPERERPRARGFLLLYGLLSSLYVALILTTLASGAVALSRHISASWGPWLLALAALTLLRRPFFRLLGAAARALSWARLTRVGVTVAILGALAFVPWPLKVEGGAVIDSRLRAAVRPEFAGTLAEVLVREGERVLAGAAVARLDPSELRSELEMVRSEIDRARSRHALLLRGPRVEEVIQAREAVKAAEAEVAQRRARQARLERLRAEGLVAADFFEQAAKELAIAEISLRSTRQQLRLVEKGARPEEVEAALAEVQRLEAKAEEIERRIEACTLRAPMAGLVLSAALDARIGERIPAGGTVLEIGDDRNLVAEVEIPESEIGDIAPGQEVRLTLAAHPDRAFSGTVQSIAAVAGRDVHGRAMFEVRCSVDDPRGLLRPGMTGAVHIDGGLRTIGTLVSRRVRRLIHPSLL